MFVTDTAMNMSIYTHAFSGKTLNHDGFLYPCLKHYQGSVRGKY